MKIQELAIIFIIIILPISLLLSEYTQFQIQTIALQTEYDARLTAATYDAIRAFQLNASNSSTSDLANSKMRDLEASITTFRNSIMTGFELNGYTEDDLNNYIPALVYTLYDGFYIYSPYKNTHDEDGNRISDEERKSMYGLKPYINYSCRYVYPRDAANPSIDVVITYALDNYITVQGKIGDEYVNKSGYLIDGIEYTPLTGNVKYNNVEIQTEELKENILLTENLSLERCSYAKINGTKYYLAKNYGTPPKNRIVYMLNGKTIVQSTEGDADFSYWKDKIVNNDNAKQYYIKAYEFTEWFKSTDLDELRYSNAIDEVIADDGTTALANIWLGNDTTIFKNNAGINIENELSNFNQHRLAVIRHKIETNLAIAISNYNTYSGVAFNNVFQMPELKENEWDSITHNISVISFLQGLHIGGKVYNGYSLVTNSESEEVVLEDNIYILGHNPGNNQYNYHKIGDKGIEGGTINVNAFSYGQQRSAGRLNLDFKRNLAISDDVTSYYYPLQEYNASYDSVVMQNNVTTYNDIYAYVNSQSNDLKEAFYTALGRERVGKYNNKFIIQIASGGGTGGSGGETNGGPTEEENTYYTITYNANGGTGAPGQTTVIAGNGANIPNTAPTRNEYIFLGWNANLFAATAKYESGDTIPAADITGDMTLYAIWKKDTYTITYNANDGTGATVQTTVQAGNDANIPNTAPTRSGYTFLGWSKDPDATTATYRAGETILAAEITTDITLYAIWEEEPVVDVTGTLGEATNDNIGDYVDLGNDIVGTNNVTTNDWRILYVENDRVYVILADFLPNSTNYAKNAGLNLVTNKAYGVNSNVNRTDLLNKLTTNSNWIGLANGVPGATATGAPTEELVLNSYRTETGKEPTNNKLDSNIANYSLYVSHTSDYNGTHNYWLATGATGSTTDLKGIQYSGEIRQDPYNNEYMGIRPVLCLPRTTKVTKNLNVWTITDINPAIPTVTITYDSNGGKEVPIRTTVNLGSDSKIPDTAPTRDDNTFLGWSKNPNATTATYELGDTIPAADITTDITLYAIWRQRYTITYNANGGTGEPEKTSVLAGNSLTVSMIQPTRGEDKFLGWSKNQNATTATYTAGGTIPAADITTDITLYAIWRQRYTITYNANEGIGAPEETSVLAGQDLTISTIQPTRGEDKFLGWSKNQNATTASYQPGGTMPASDITGDTTLYAIWEQQRYTITYDANQGTGAPGPTTVLWGESATIPDTVPTRTGTARTTYTFVGWSTTIKTPSATVTADYAPGETIPASEINSDKTLYATYHSQSSYGIKYYIVLFNQQGGSDGPIALRVRQGSAGTIPTTVPTKEGYTFLGWSTTANATTATYAAGASITPSANMTLYAVWRYGTTTQQYTITFNGNATSGVSGVPDAIQTNSDGTATIPNTIPTRRGNIMTTYTFIGWSKDPDATTATYTAGGTIPAADIQTDTILYAIYETSGWGNWW